MRKFLVPAIASLLAMAAGPSWAWSRVSGNINSIDPSAHQITLDNGTTYTLRSNINLANLAVGDKVTVSTETYRDLHLVNRVTKTS